MPSEPSPLPSPRVESLAARVRWLDRYRRVLSLAAAVMIAPYLVCQAAEAVSADWPAIHATLLAVVLGAITWWLIEVGLVYVTALWETEHDHLVRDRGLPRAVLLKIRARYTSP